MGATTTERSVRTITLPAYLVPHLKRWKLACPLSPAGLVLPGEPDASGVRGAIEADKLLRNILRSALRKCWQPTGCLATRAVHYRTPPKLCATESGGTSLTGVQCWPRENATSSGFDARRGQFTYQSRHSYPPATGHCPRTTVDRRRDLPAIQRPTLPYEAPT